MKTFETEKNNIPEGATHYSEQSGVIEFAWLKEVNGELMVWVPENYTYWHEASVFYDHYRATMKPIPKPEVVEWKNGDTAIWEKHSPVTVIGKDISRGPFSNEDRYVVSFDHDDTDENGHSKFSSVWSSDLSKPESPEEKEQRERLEAAYDLYCLYAKMVDWPIVSIDEFKENHPDKDAMLAIVDKTNCRKGE